MVPRWFWQQGSNLCIALKGPLKTFYLYIFTYISYREWCVSAPAVLWDIPITLLMRLSMSRDTQWPVGGPSGMLLGPAARTWARQPTPNVVREEDGTQLLAVDRSRTSMDLLVRLP